MYKNIINRDIFQIIDGSASLTVSDSTTVQLYVSADGVTYTPKGDAITTPETIVISNAPQGLYCYFDGLTDGQIYKLLL